MATYTDNYQFTKPTYAEIADVQAFNNNMTKIDQILHASQVSLAPAYDPTETYNAGDVVMYELLMYECQEDGVTGVWDPAKWGRTTAGEHGGGSDVEPNPTGEPTATLTKLGIEGTIYGIEGSGGGNVYGAFIDTNRVIQAETACPSGQTTTYTATEDCAVRIKLWRSGNNNASEITIDDVVVGTIYGSGTEAVYYTLYLKSGQELGITPTSASAYIAYGLTFGTNNIFTPQIYSTEEREVGVWIDNKPLYQKTYIAASLTNNVDNVIDASFGSTKTLVKSDIDFDGILNTMQNNNSSFDDALYVNNDVLIYYLSKSGSWWTELGSAKITIYYTKTTDTAGSGSYNTLGVPMVHYSTDEQVIGTFEDANGIIKTLYQKMVRFTNIAKNGDIPFGVTGGENYMLITGKLSDSITLPYIHGSAPSNNIGGFFDGDKWSLRSGVDAPSTVSGFIIIQYTKTTD